MKGGFVARKGNRTAKKVNAAKKANTNAAPQSLPKHESPIASSASPFQSREPRWGIRATLALSGIFIAVASATIAYRVAWSVQARREHLQSSQIGYAWFVKPAPTPGESFEETGRYEVSMMVSNNGPANLQTAVLHLRTPPPEVFLHSAPEL